MQFDIRIVPDDDKSLFSVYLHEDLAYKDMQPSEVEQLTIADIIVSAARHCCFS